MDTVEIPLTRGKVTIVDKSVYERVLIGLKWCCSKGNYAIRRNCKKTEYLHVLIMNPPEGYVVDHINSDTLDNRISNLRICSQKDNVRNRKMNKNKKFKGVGLDKRFNKFRARIRVNYKHIFLGHFDTEIEAAIAYNNAAILYHGKFAKLNEV